MDQPWFSFNFFILEASAFQPTVAISACLNGEPVRYDGTDKQLNTVSTYLRKHLNLLPICPEVGAGMSVPRPPIQLQTMAGAIQAIGRDDPTLNMTQALTDYAQHSLEPLTDVLHGYIFKGRSPSCGVASTPLYDENGSILALTSGLQASYVQQHFPWLPLRQETELQEIADCEWFIWHCLAMADIRRACREQQLTGCHQHYQPIWRQFTSQDQDKLLQYLHSGEDLLYCQTINAALNQTQAVLQLNR